MSDQSASTDNAFSTQGHISKDCTQPQRRACYTCGSEGSVYSVFTRRWVLTTFSQAHLS